jgi:hypothetical protein
MSPQPYDTLVKRRYPVGTKLVIKDDDGTIIGWGIIDNTRYVDAEQGHEFHLTFDDNSEGWYSEKNHMEVLEKHYQIIRPDMLDEDLFTI